jgi:adenine C2-methylase RlmN of 23S rRNA A2503 and tRNA A37
MIRDKLYGNHINVSDTHQVQEGSLAPFLNNLDEYLACNYLYQEKRKGVFISSSGLCNLRCPYCITNRPRDNNNLNKDDFSFIFNYFGENIYFVFSGIGDFFCG